MASKSVPIGNLLLRLLTFVFLVVSIIILATDSATLTTVLASVKVRFNDIYAYRYAFSTAVIGCAYTLLQIPFSIYHVSMGKRLVGGGGLLYFDFFGDKIIAFLLVSGASAGFGYTVDMKKLVDAIDGSDNDLSKSLQMANVSFGFLLIGFLCMAALSVLSSLSLAKK